MYRYIVPRTFQLSRRRHPVRGAGLTGGARHHRILLGGLEVGQNTLLRFYVVHVILLPLVATIFLAVHFWRIRKDGGISGGL